MITSLTLSQLAQNYGGTLMYPDCQFNSVSTDSRHIGEGQLFVALRGEHFDAHEFLPEVATRAVGMVVECPVKDINVPQWVVPDTTTALGQLARTNRDLFLGPVIAVTGSSGKTTVKEMIAAILQVSGSVLATPGNLNNHIGVPLTLFLLGSEHRFAVIEMGASALGEIEYLCRLARPDVALVNNVLPAHVEGFGSVENIAKGKGEIYQSLSTAGTAVINLDERYSDTWHGLTEARVMTISLLNSNADFTAKNIVLDDRGRAAFVLVTPAGEAAIKLSLSGQHNVGNALAAAACAYSAGAELGAIAAGLNHLKTVPGRLSFERLPNGATVIDDSYNANPGSVKAAIDTLVSLSGHSILVLGDMGELGKDEASLHAEIGRYAVDRGVDQLLCLGTLCANAATAFGRGAQHFESKDLLLQHLANKPVSAADVVLVKGSRYMAMEQVVHHIKEWGGL